MSAHTPGPWEYSEENGEPCVMAGDYYVATAHAGMPGVDFGVGESKANARLIAAAPELKDAVQAAIDEFAIGSFNASRRQRVVEFLRAAIAKAEGSR